MFLRKVSRWGLDFCTGLLIYNVNLLIKRISVVCSRGIPHLRGQLYDAVETLAYGSCSHSISRSPKLPLVFLKLHRNTVRVFYFLNNRYLNSFRVVRDSSLQLHFPNFRSALAFWTNFLHKYTLIDSKLSQRSFL